MDNFREALNSNGYPQSFVDYVMTNENRSKRKSKITKGDVFFKFPFINDKINGKLNGIFRSAGLPVRTYSKSKTLRSILQRKREYFPCKLENCTINDPKLLCFTKNCVYECVCEGCGENYIGSTIRPLHIRVREHLSDENSSVFKHRQQCKANFQFRVELVENDVINLRLKEALLIKKNQPPINSRVELNDLTSFISF